MNRICKTCKEEKNITEFPKNKNGKDGYESTCKTCKKIKTLERLEKNRTDLPSEKVCNTCKTLLPIENYSVNNNLKFGRSNRCKECDKKVWSVYKEANKERINREYVERYHSDPEFREHRLEIGKQVREKRKVEHPEKIILQYYGSCKDPPEEPEERKLEERKSRIKKLIREELNKNPEYVKRIKECTREQGVDAMLLVLKEFGVEITFMELKQYGFRKAGLM